MRIATGFGASAAVLIFASAVGWFGPWALAVGSLFVLLAAVVATTAMESRDAQLDHQAAPQPTVLRRAA